MAEQLQNQIIAMQDVIQKLSDRLQDAESEIARNGSRGRTSGGGDTREVEFVSKKFFDPEPFTSKDVWREWADEFIDFVAERPGVGESLAAGLEQARIRTIPYESLGDTGEQVAAAKALFRLLKKLIKHPQAKALLVHAPNKNVWEGWRLISQRFDPATDANNAASALALVNPKLWHAKKPEHLPVVVARWEGLALEHERRTGEVVLSESLKREMFMEILPKEMASHFRMQSLSMEGGFNYATLRALAMKWVVANTHAAGTSHLSQYTNPDAMEVDALKEMDEEDVDSFGKGPKGGGIGKGLSKGKTRACYCCGEDHPVAQCTNWNKVNPKTNKTLGAEYEAARKIWRDNNPKGKGKKGGGKDRGKKGIGELDGDWQEDEKAEGECGLLEAGFCSGIGGDGSDGESESGLFHALSLEDETLCGICMFGEDTDSDDDDVDIKDLVRGLGDKDLNMGSAKVDEWQVECPWTAAAAQARGLRDISTASAQRREGNTMSPEEFRAATLIDDRSLSASSATFSPGAPAIHSSSRISQKVPKVPVSWNDVQSLFLEHMAPAAPPGDAVPNTKFMNNVINQPTFSEMGVSLDENPNIKTKLDRIVDPNFIEINYDDDDQESREAASHPTDEPGLGETLGPPGLGVSGAAGRREGSSQRSAPVKTGKGNGGAKFFTVEHLEEDHPEEEQPEVNSGDSDEDWDEELLADSSSSDGESGEHECMCEKRSEHLSCSSNECANKRHAIGAMPSGVETVGGEEEPEGLDELIRRSEAMAGKGKAGKGGSGVPRPKVKRKLDRILRSVEKELIDAWAKGKDLEFFVKEVEMKEPERFKNHVESYPGIDFDSMEFTAIDGVDNITLPKGMEVSACGKWIRVKSGITLDSGCSVFVMPADWLTFLKLEQSEGSKAGQVFRVANNGTLPNLGQRTVKFVTKDGRKRKMVFQVAKVNKILASIAGICDNGNTVTFTDKGGYIKNIETGRRTTFERKGNVYVLDMWGQALQC